MPGIPRASRAHAHGPERARVAVLAAGVLQPLPAVAHEIAEMAGLVVQRRREKCEVAGREPVQIFQRRIAAGLIEQIAEDEGARIVVRAVAFVKIRHVENRVLKNPRAVRHADDLVEPQRWQIVRPARVSHF